MLAESAVSFIFFYLYISIFLDFNHVFKPVFGFKIYILLNVLLFFLNSFVLKCLHFGVLKTHSVILTLKG